MPGAEDRHEIQHSCPCPNRLDVAQTANELAEAVCLLIERAGDFIKSKDSEARNKEL